MELPGTRRRNYLRCATSPIPYDILRDGVSKHSKPRIEPYSLLGIDHHVGSNKTLLYMAELRSDQSGDKE